jgi:hypothetical protein
VTHANVNDKKQYEKHLLSNLVALKRVQIRTHQRGGRGGLGRRLGRERHGWAGEGRAEEARRRHGSAIGGALGDLRRQEDVM